MINGETAGLLSFLSVLFPEDMEESAKDTRCAEHAAEKLDWIDASLPKIMLLSVHVDDPPTHRPPQAEAGGARRLLPLSVLP